MRVLIQRVSRASVTVDGAVVGAIGPGLLLFVGIGPGDAEATIQRLAAKVVELRIFEDEDGRMNRSLLDVGGAVLAVSQFTLYGDVRRGRRPSFAGAASPALANERYLQFCSAIEAHGVVCAQGVFGAHMDVELLNDGPVTLLIDSDDLDRPRRA